MIEINVHDASYRNFLVEIGTLFAGDHGDNYVGTLTMEAFASIGVVLTRLPASIAGNDSIAGFRVRHV